MSADRRPPRAALFIVTVTAVSAVVQDQGPPLRVVPLEQTRPAGQAGNVPGTNPPMPTVTYPGGNGSVRLAGN